MLTCATTLASTLWRPWRRQRDGPEGWRLLMGALLGALVGPCLLRVHRAGRWWWRRRWLQRYRGRQLLTTHACRAGAPQALI